MRTLKRVVLVGMLAVGLSAVGCVVEPTGDGETDTASSGTAINHLSDITMLSVSGAETDMHIFQLPEIVFSSVRVELREQSGNVTLLAENAEREGEVIIPSFRNDFDGSLVTVDVFVDGELFGGIDIYTVESLPEIPEGMERSVLSEGYSSYLIDLTLTEQTASDRISGSVQVDCGQVDDIDGVEGVSRQALSNCGNGISGPGVGRFLSSSPGPYGQRFSYCPESTPTLNWAAQGDFTIDALYNQYWGCTSALKNPNNCTTTVNTSGVISWCCGFPWYTPSWINPSTDPYFPDCPLIN